MMGVEVVGLGLLIGAGFCAPTLWRYWPALKDRWREWRATIPNGSSTETVAPIDAGRSAPRSARNVLTMILLGVVLLASLATFGTVDGLTRVLHGVICVVSALGAGFYLAFPDRMAPHR